MHRHHHLLAGSVWSFYGATPFFTTASSDINYMLNHLSIEEKANIMQAAFSMEGVFTDVELSQVVADSVTDATDGHLAASTYILKWIRCFASNSDKMSSVLLDILRLMSSGERVDFINKLWHCVLYDKDGVPQYNYIDGGKYL